MVEYCRCIDVLITCDDELNNDTMLASIVDAVAMTNNTVCGSISCCLFLIVKRIICGF